MESLVVGLRVLDADGKTGCVVDANADSLQLEWTHRSVLVPSRERVSIVSPKMHQLQALTLTEGWKPMSELIREAGSAPKSLLEDLQGLLAESIGPEPEALEEASKKSATKAAASSAPRGKDLEKQAREKRRAKGKEGKKGGGHNPFKTKTKLGPGPRHGTNSQTKKWKCRCATPYKCLCRAGKLHKVVRIKPGYKKSYNHEYKAWRKGQRKWG